MLNNDSIKLLKECDAGTKMAVSAIDDVRDKVSDKELMDLLMESKKHHEKLGNDLHSLLEQNNSSEKEPNPIAKSMSWFKTNMKLSMNDSDNKVADLITQGCDMGVKSLHKYLNQYSNAEQPATSICRDLIDIEEKLRDGLKKYL